MLGSVQCLLVPGTGSSASPRPEARATLTTRQEVTPKLVLVLPAQRCAALCKLCVRGFFSPQPDWELEVHMVTDNSQLSVKLFRRKCYMTDVSTTALSQTDGGKKGTGLESN